MNGDRGNWLDSYYDALEFFYFEPQHMRVSMEKAAEVGGLEKIASQARKIDKIRKHLRGMEVTLNHNINQFFRLAPRGLRNQLFAKLFGRDFVTPFVMHGPEVDAEFELRNSTQPDLVFLSDRELVSFEMKVKAKCTIEQVLKYALLGLAVELKVGRRDHFLVLLGSGTFATQWRNHFESIERLREAISTEAVAAFILKQSASLRAHSKRFSEIVDQMQLAFLNYDSFARLLRTVADGQGQEDSPSAEVYRNLIHGLIGEFERRELCSTDYNPA